MLAAASVVACAWRLGGVGLSQMESETRENHNEIPFPAQVFLLTDDQDVIENYLDYMPKLNKLLRDWRKGWSLSTSYLVSTALAVPTGPLS